jgi:hypothetical protein
MIKLTDENIVHIGDIFAIPMFALLTYYFYKKPNKNDLENILYLFAIIGFIADTYFTVMFFLKHKNVNM